MSSLDFTHPRTNFAPLSDTYDLPVPHIPASIHVASASHGNCHHRPAHYIRLSSWWRTMVGLLPRQILGTAFLLGIAGQGHSARTP